MVGGGVELMIPGVVLYYTHRFLIVFDLAVDLIDMKCNISSISMFKELDKVFVQETGSYSTALFFAKARTVSIRKCHE